MARLGVYKKAMLLLLLPLIYGFIAERYFGRLPRIFSMIPTAGSQLLFAAFWFYIGSLFASLNKKRVINFFLGNILWLLFFGIFIWQYFVLHREMRDPLWALIAQYYNFAYFLGAMIIMAITEAPWNLENIMLISYLTMFATFIAGFAAAIIMEKVKNRRINRLLKDAVDS